MNDLTIACVLRSGGLYDGRWVRRLRRNVERHAPAHRFVCLSDTAIEGVETVPLAHDWPRWWPILEVFRPGLFTGRVAYLDLCDLVVGWDPRIHEGEGFIIAPDPYDVGPRRFATGLMAFDAGDTDIYDSFVPVADDAIRRLHGDQEYIAEYRPDATTYPLGIAVSYKGACRNTGGYPDGASIVFVHGRPKPHQITDPWFRRLWAEDQEVTG